MIGGINYASSQISTAYNSISQSLADTLTRISTGKKFQNASEDLIGFIRSKNLESDISGYEEVQQNLTEFKTYTTAAVDVASTIYEKLTDMKKLATQYTDAGTAGDTDKQALYLSEFTALQTEVSSMVDNAKVDGINLMTTGSNLASVTLTPGGTGTLNLNFTTNTSKATIDAFDLEAATPTTAADVQDEIDNVLAYMSEAKSYDGIANQQLKLTDTIINSKQAVKALITDIDEAQETSQALDLQIRQQAAMSMLAQANVSRQAVLKLYS